VGWGRAFGGPGEVLPPLFETQVNKFIREDEELCEDPKKRADKNRKSAAQWYP